jgi:hypothetical protein
VSSSNRPCEFHNDGCPRSTLGVSCSGRRVACDLVTRHFCELLNSSFFLSAIRVTFVTELPKPAALANSDSSDLLNSQFLLLNSYSFMGSAVGYFRLTDFSLLHAPNSWRQGMSNVRRDPDSSPRKSDAYASSSSSSSVVRPVMSGSSLSMAASIAARFFSCSRRILSSTVSRVISL